MRGNKYCSYARTYARLWGGKKIFPKSCNPEEWEREKENLWGEKREKINENGTDTETDRARESKREKQRDRDREIIYGRKRMRK